MKMEVYDLGHIKVSLPSDADAGIEPGDSPEMESLKFAGLIAREVARVTDTAIVYEKDGKLVHEYPARNGWTVPRKKADDKSR